MLHTDIAVVIPVGPGHEEAAERAVSSVQAAWTCYKGNFARLQIIVEPDSDATGAAQTRNRGLEKVKTPWVVFLDADDLFEEKAFFSMMIGQMAYPEAKGLWGLWAAAILPGMPVPRYPGPPFSWDTLLARRGHGVGMTGMFRTEEARRLGFDERMPRAEGIEFCFAFACNWPVEIMNAPIIIVDHTTASALGPKSQGHERVLKVRRELRARYTERGRVPFTEEEFRERRTEDVRGLRGVLQVPTDRGTGVGMEGA